MTDGPIILGDGGATLPAPNAVAAGPPPAPAAETIAAVLGDSIAERLKAKQAELERGTRDFPLPGWDGLLVLRARVIRSRKELQAEVGDLTNEQLIVNATAALLVVNDAGELEELPGGWSGLGAKLGLPLETISLGKIVAGALDNPLRLDAFAEDLLAWMMGRRSAIEQVLGG